MRSPGTAGRVGRLLAIVGFLMVLAVSAGLFANTVGCLQVLSLEGSSVLRTESSTVDAGEVTDAGGGNMVDVVKGCAPGQKECNGGCVEKTDWKYGCGSTDCTPCSVPFAASLKCDNGKCAPATCKPGRADCDLDPANGCEADLLSAATCGNCGVACPLGQVCNPNTALAKNECAPSCTLGLSNCNGSCVDTKVSGSNCGSCGNVCPSAKDGDPACTAGACTIDCHQGFGDCDRNPSTCEPLAVFYEDLDGDGWGTANQTMQACAAVQGFAPKLGDCNDGNKDVYPGQTAFFGAPYVINNHASFDYDCNGVEQDPGVQRWPGNCNTSCLGSGYSPAQPARSGQGIDPYCGSTELLQCSGGGTTQSSQSNLHPTTAPTGTQPICGIVVNNVPPVPCK